MNKSITAILFSILFVSFTMAPSVLAVVDDSYDISILISSAEEEENKGEEKVKDIEVEVPLIEITVSTVYRNNLLKHLIYHSDNYNSLVKELVSPPPEINI